jgi:hypothetical protein
MSAARDFGYAVLYSIDEEVNSFYVWADYGDNRIDLYAQKLDMKGILQWTKDGLLIGLIFNKSTFIYTPKLIKPDSKSVDYILCHSCINTKKLTAEIYMHSMFRVRVKLNGWTMVSKLASKN